MDSTYHMNIPQKSIKLSEIYFQHVRKPIKAAGRKMSLWLGEHTIKHSLVLLYFASINNNAAH